MHICELMLIKLQLYLKILIFELIETQISSSAVFCILERLLYKNKIAKQKGQRGQFSPQHDENRCKDQLIY